MFINHWSLSSALSNVLQHYVMMGWPEVDSMGWRGSFYFGFYLTTKLNYTVYTEKSLGAPWLQCGDIFCINLRRTAATTVSSVSIWSLEICTPGTSPDLAQDKTKARESRAGGELCNFLIFVSWIIMSAVPWPGDSNAELKYKLVSLAPSSP